MTDPGGFSGGVVSTLLDSERPESSEGAIWMNNSTSFENSVLKDLA